MHQQDETAEGPRKGLHTNRRIPNITSSGRCTIRATDRPVGIRDTSNRDGNRYDAHNAQERLKRRHAELQSNLPPAPCLRSTLHVPTPTNTATHRAGTPRHSSRLQTNARMPGQYLPTGVDCRLVVRAQPACRNNIHRLMPEIANVTLRLQLRGGMRVHSRHVPVRRGILQGDILSPLCFVTALDEIFRKHSLRKRRNLSAK